MKPRLFAATLIGIVFASAAATAGASEYCTGAPREQWKPEADARAVTESLGYRVARIKADDGCYEVYALDKSGKRFELKFNPADMSMVSRYAVRGARTLAWR